MDSNTDYKREASLELAWGLRHWLRTYEGPFNKSWKEWLITTRKAYNL